MAILRIEDDDDQLKVPADEIPPVRAVDGDDGAAAAAGAAAARALGGLTSSFAPPPNAPRQIPGLAFRAAHGEKTKKANDR